MVFQCYFHYFHSYEGVGCWMVEKGEFFTIFTLVGGGDDGLMTKVIFTIFTSFTTFTIFTRGGGG